MYIKFINCIMGDNEKGVIICVDDEVSVLETLKEQLMEHFSETHEVHTCISAEDALELMGVLIDTDQPLEMVITDQVMPGMKGDELLHKIHARLPDTIKILLTGHSGLESVVSSVNKGGLNRYIEKPWDMSVIKEDIESLISKYRENLENRRIINNLEKQIKQLEENQSIKSS